MTALPATAYRLVHPPMYTNTIYLWLSCGIRDTGFAFWTVVTRLYPTEMVGLVGTAITTSFLLGQIGQLGLGYALIRFVPQSKSGAARGMLVPI